MNIIAKLMQKVPERKPRPEVDHNTVTKLKENVTLCENATLRIDENASKGNLGKCNM